MFPPGTRVIFRTILGDEFGTVVAVLEEAVDGDHVHRVRPDNGAFPALLLLGRSLRDENEADAPLLVVRSEGTGQ